MNLVLQQINGEDHCSKISTLTFIDEIYEEHLLTNEMSIGFSVIFLKSKHFHILHVQFVSYSNFARAYLIDRLCLFVCGPDGAGGSNDRLQDLLLHKCIDIISMQIKTYELKTKLLTRHTKTHIILILFDTRRVKFINFSR